MRMTFRVTRFALRAEVDGPVEKRRHESHRDGISDRSRRKAGLFESHRDGILDRTGCRDDLSESHRDGSLDRTGCRDDLSESHRDGSLDRSRRKAVFFESHRDGILDRTGCRDDLSESHWDGISDRSRRTAGLFESHRDGISDGPLHSIHTVSIKTFKRNDRNRFQSKLPSRWDSQGVFNHDHLSKLPSRWDSYCMQCNYSDAGFPPVNPAKVGIHSILYHPYTHSRAYLCPPVLDPNTLTGTTHLNHKTHTHSGASESATTRNHHA